MLLFSNPQSGPGVPAGEGDGASFSARTIYVSGTSEPNAHRAECGRTNLSGAPTQYTQTNSLTCTRKPEPLPWLRLLAQSGYERHARTRPQHHQGYETSPTAAATCLARRWDFIRSTDEPKDGQPKPSARLRTNGSPLVARTNPRCRPATTRNHTNESAIGTNEPTPANCTNTVGVAVPVSPWPAPRRRRPRSSPPPGYRRRHAAGPWCGHRSTGSPACRTRRRSGPW